MSRRPSLSRGARGGVIRLAALPAEFLIVILTARPGEVDRSFANLRGATWNAPFRAGGNGG